MPKSSQFIHGGSMTLGESDTRAKLIDPAIHARGWTEDLIKREESAGAIEIIDGRPTKRPKGRIDYTLRIRVHLDTQPVAVAFLERQERRRVASPPAPQDTKGVRFSARSVKAQRARLGLSAKDFGRLVGVSALTVYSWESGKSRPRRKPLAGLAPVRRLGKREAQKRLEMLVGLFHPHPCPSPIEGEGT